MLNPLVTHRYRFIHLECLVVFNLFYCTDSRLNRRWKPFRQRRMASLQMVRVVTYPLLSYHFYAIIGRSVIKTIISGPDVSIEAK